MKVNMISYTKPTQYMIDKFNLDIDPDLQDLICFCARVSNPENQTNRVTTDKLINYLVRNKHWSPFAMVNACMEIETTRDIARQILRHKTAEFQEFSQRYADPTKELEFVTRECRLQDPKNRQNSILSDNPDLDIMWERLQLEHIAATKRLYEWAIDNNIAKEQARAVLPEGNTVSRLYMNATIRTWIHYIEVRTESGTQQEHRLVALECAKAIQEIFPAIINYVQQ